MVRISNTLATRRIDNQGLPPRTVGSYSSHLTGLGEGGGKSN